MLDVEKKIRNVLKTVPLLEKEAGSKTNFEKLLEEALFINGGHHGILIEVINKYLQIK